MIAIERQILQMQRMTMPELRERYREAFGESTRSRHKQWLVKRIAWRLQATDEGELSERARQRAIELANDADLRLTPPKEDGSSLPDRTVRPHASAGQRAGTTRSQPRSNPPTGRTVTTSAPRDRRLPTAGTVLTREYQGRTIRVTVTHDGFEFDGEMFASLSAVAKSVTGSHCNGFAFFKLGGSK